MRAAEPKKPEQTQKETFAHLPYCQPQISDLASSDGAAFS